MKRNMLGEPRPKDHEEMVEAIDERDADPAQLNATVEFNEGDGEYDGWTAEVRFNESGDEVFSTMGYKDKDELLADLKAAGIKEIEEI